MSTFHGVACGVDFEKSYLGHLLRGNARYGFMPHYIYFLKNMSRWQGSSQIHKRLLAPVPVDDKLAWIVWREFRSAQAEVTSIFLVETFLKGNIQGLERSPVGFKKTCDLAVHFIRRELVYIEVKAQSGQQRGDGHPLSEMYLFPPQGEEDLASWLFDGTKKSSTKNVFMIPKCKEAEDKGADVLMAMMDVFQFKTRGLIDFGSYLAPDWLSMEVARFGRVSLGNAKLNRRYRREMEVVTLTVGLETTRKMGKLREIWLFDDSNLHRLLILRAQGVSSILCSGTVEISRPRLGHRTRW